jgi:hypothetical protein
MLVNWLSGVAYQTARKARAVRARRQQREKQVVELPEPAAPEQQRWRDLEAVLDQELCRLPEKYRAAMLLCDVHGLTRKEAARRLGLPEGTLSGLLSRGRTMLATRLARHGWTLSAGTFGVALAQPVVVGVPPPALLASTIRLNRQVAANPAALGGVTPAVARLTRGVLRTMLLSKLKCVSTVLVPLAFVLALAVPASPRSAESGAAKPAAPPAKASAGGQRPPPATGWRPTFTLKHEYPVTVVATSPAWSAAGDQNGNVVVWDTKSGKNRKRFGGAKDFAPVDWLRFTADGKHLFLGFGGCRWLFRYTPEAPEKTRGPGGIGGGETPAQTFQGVSADGETWLWSFKGGRLLWIRQSPFTPHNPGPEEYEEVKFDAALTHTLLSPDDKWLAVVTKDGNLHIYEPSPLKEVQTLAVPKEKVTAIAFSPDGKRLAVVAEDASAKVYATETGREVADLKGHEGIVYAVAFSPDGKTVATGGDDQTARLWDAATGQPLAILRGHTNGVRAVAFGATGDTLITGSLDMTVIRWKCTR